MQVAYHDLYYVKNVLPSHNDASCHPECCSIRNTTMFSLLY